MKKHLIAFTGLIIFSLSIFLFRNLAKSEELALEKDDKKTSYGSIAEGPFPCEWNVKPPERVTSENKSQSILVSVNNNMNEKCESVLALRAPGFDISPTREEQTITLPASKSGTLSWIISPRKTGVYEIAVSDLLNTKIFGITVTNTFGFTTIQAKLLSILGSLFGPMFTIPWWWDKWQQRKKKQIP